MFAEQCSGRAFPCPFLVPVLPITPRQRPCPEPGGPGTLRAPLPHMIKLELQSPVLAEFLSSAPREEELSPWTQFLLNVTLWTSIPLHTQWGAPHPGHDLVATVTYGGGGAEAK